MYELHELVASSGAQVLRAAVRKRVMALFAAPVPREEPFYHEVIRRPMDLGTITTRLSRGHFKSLGARSSQQVTRFHIQAIKCRTMSLL